MRRRVGIATGAVGLVEHGRPVDGGAPPLVLLHGFTGNADAWTPLAADLARDRRVVAIDLPGHGETAIVPGGFAPTTEALLGTLDAIGVARFDLLGYSMGGRIALAVALAASSRIARLVLESSSPGLATAEERVRRRADDERLAREIESGGVERFVDSWERLPLFASLARLAPSERRALRAIRLSNRAEGLAACLRDLGVGSQPWLGDGLGGLAVPTLIVAGAEDDKFAAIARVLAAALPHARLRLVSGAGHVPHVEARDAFVEALRGFLEPIPREEIRCSTGRP